MMVCEVMRTHWPFLRSNAKPVLRGSSRSQTTFPAIPVLPSTIGRRTYCPPCRSFGHASDLSQRLVLEAEIRPGLDRYGFRAVLLRQPGHDLEPLALHAAVDAEAVHLEQS